MDRGSLKSVENIWKRIRDCENDSKAIFMGVWGYATFYLKPKFYGTPDWTVKRVFGLPGSKKKGVIYTPEELYTILTNKDPEINFWYLQVLFSLFEELVKESCSVICTEEKIDSSKYRYVKMFLSSKKPYDKRKDGVERVAMADSKELAELKLAKVTRNCFTHSNSKVNKEWCEVYANARGVSSELKVGDRLPIELTDVEEWQALISIISARLVGEAKSQSHAKP